MSPGADSAGTPWEGRRFEENAFQADDGSASPELAEALTAFHAGASSATEVVDAFRHARLLVPLVAHLGEEGESETGHPVDKSQELSIVTVAGPDGRSVLPVFSSVDTMKAWDSSARPVPADGERIALAAAGEGTDLVVLDPTSPSEFVLRRPALWAIAQRESWTPSPNDPDVFRAFTESVGQELGVVDLALIPGDPAARLAGPELIVRLALAHGLTREEFDAILARLAQRWASSDVIATRVDSIKVELVEHR
jgi:hypothetical protein